MPVIDDEVPNRFPEWPEEPETGERAPEIAQPGNAQPDTTDIAGQSGEAELLASVRRSAGWRVSPRQLAAALEATSSVEGDPSVERLAELVDAMRGDRSQRQSRHAELWRALGAELAVHGQPSDPAAQRAFIGEARARAGQWAGDALLLRIALEVAASGKSDDSETEPAETLEARQVALVARGLRRRFGRQLDRVDIRAEDGRFADVLAETIGQVRERLSQPVEELEHPTRQERPRERDRGGRFDRPRSRLGVSADRFGGPRKRTHRRAKPAGVSRKPRTRKKR